MQSIKQTLHKKFLLLTMVVVMLTGTITTGYVETAQAETTVYITKTGSKYHTHKCGNGTYYAVSRSTALAKGLTPCKKCYPNGDSGSSSSSGSSNQSTQTTTKTMKINKSSLEMVKGQTVTLKVSDAPGSVTWSSGNPAVVSVSSSGTLTAKKKGNATITVASGNQKKQCKVTVEEPGLNKTSLTMELKEVKTLKLSGCRHSVKWSSSDSDIVKVKNGELTAKGVGKAVVKAKVHGETYSCKVTVKKPAITDIKLGAYIEEMDSADWQEVQVKTTPSYAVKYYQVSVTSSDPSIVSAEVIDDWDEVYIELTSGYVSGEATITVSIGGETESFTVKVTDDEAEEQFAPDGF